MRSFNDLGRVSTSCTFSPSSQADILRLQRCYTEQSKFQIGFVSGYYLWYDASLLQEWSYSLVDPATKCKLIAYPSTHLTMKYRLCAW